MRTYYQVEMATEKQKQLLKKLKTEKNVDVINKIEASIEIDKRITFYQERRKKKTENVVEIDKIPLKYPKNQTETS